MDGRTFFIISPLVVAAVVSAWLAVYTWRRRVLAGAGFFALVMASVAAWSLASIATHLSATLPAKFFWTNLQYVGISLVPAAWLLFVLQYAGHQEAVTPRTMGLLAIHPILTQIVVWTDSYHHLFRRSVWLDTTGSIVTMGNTLGPAFWVHTVYSYGLLLVGSYLLIRSHLHRPRVYRRQGLALLVALIAPWVANVATITGASSLSHLDLTPFAFTISGVAITWGLFRYALFDLVPVAQRAVVENLGAGVIVLDHRDRIVDINPAATDVLDVDAEAVLGTVLSKVLPQYAYVVTRSREVGDISDEIVLGQGQEQRIFDLRVSSLTDGRSHVIGHLLSLQDITERKESQLALSRYAERLRLLYEIDQAVLSAQSPETIAAAVLGKIHHLLPVQRASVVAFDNSGDARVLASRAMGKLSDGEIVWASSLDRGALVGERVLRVDLTPQIRKGAPPLDQRLFDEGVRTYLLVPLVAQNQVVGSLNLETTKPDAYASEHIDVASQIATSLAVALQNARLYAAAQQEIGERRLAEAALRESEASLRQKADDLAARNAELDAFAHTVAHDLKTPLSLLTGYTSYIEAGGVEDDPEQLAWCVRAIGQSARKMSNIIDELLLLASVRKMDEVDVQPLDMSVIVSDVLLRFTDLIDQHDAEVFTPQAWPVASGYAPWVEEVWANYVSNAIKYGGKPPRVELGATVVEANGGGEKLARVRFWVRDNGEGLSGDQRARLFIPFERLEQARAKGYGLGLSIVHRIMERLGGEAGVESVGESGEGSLFYFVLPQADLPS